MNPTAQSPVAEQPLKIVGSNIYGRYPKISGEHTFNMIISDGFLVPMPGNVRKLNVKQNGSFGRTIYASTNTNFMIQVIDAIVYRIDGPATDLNAVPIMTLGSSSGDVFIAENVANQIAICDQADLWVYNWETGVSTRATLPINTETGLQITPGYITYHNGFLLVPDITASFWYLSELNDFLSWNWNSGQSVAGNFQTEGDRVIAAIRVPGKGSLVLILGRNGGEYWNLTGEGLFPYRKNTSIGIEYGCLSPSTIATIDEMVIWLGTNNKSGAAIMVADGGPAKRLSTDGIDFQLDELVNPSSSYGFCYKINGHVFYQLTFTDPADNLSILYDFTTQKFFTPTDEHMNHHKAAAVAFFNDTYYFAAINDGYLYEMNSNLTNYDYTEPSIFPVNPNPANIQTIPRVRVCNTVRLKDGSRFIANSLAFTIEQGADPYYQSNTSRFLASPEGVVVADSVDEGFIGTFVASNTGLQPYVPCIDLSVARDGAVSFGNAVRKDLNPLAKRASKIVFYKLGAANDFTVQLRFYSLSRVVVTDGTLQLRMGSMR